MSKCDGDWMAEIGRVWKEKEDRIADLESLLAAAIAWIRTVSEELVAAGGKCGDRNVALANLRDMVSQLAESKAELFEQSACRRREHAGRCTANAEIERLTIIQNNIDRMALWKIHGNGDVFDGGDAMCLVVDAALATRISERKLNAALNDYLAGGRDGAALAGERDE